jgi:type 1 glutamine amidotransferase
MKKWSLCTVLAILGAWGLAAVAAAAPAAREGTQPHVVFLIGEDEYKTETTLPAFARSDLEPAGFRVSIVHASKTDPNDFPGMVAALADADLVVLSVRRRTPPQEQLDALRAYLDAGKPLVGIRTACHAFALRPKDKLTPGHAQWADFDPQVIGGHYTNHHGVGPKTTITAAPGGPDDRILRGIDAAKLQGNGSLYRVSPLEPGTHPLLIGTIPGKDPEPVAWTHRYGPKQARIFFTSLGHIDDFDEPGFRRLLSNAVSWALDRPGRASEPK